MGENRIWRYVEPGDDDQPVTVVMTDAEILEEYFPWWSVQMRKVGKDTLITPENCIDDWVVVHWAEPVDDGGRVGTSVRV